MIGFPTIYLPAGWRKEIVKVQVFIGFEKKNPLTRCKADLFRKNDISCVPFRTLTSVINTMDVD